MREPASKPKEKYIYARNITDKSYSPCGEFDWQIAWKTNGRNGYVVQEVKNTYEAQRCDGTPSRTIRQTPQYWEAWYFDKKGISQQRDGAINDTWGRFRNPETTGSWSMNGNVYWVDKLDASDGWGTGNVPDARDLVSTTTQPKNLGSSLLERRAVGVWDCCDGNNRHDAY